MARVLFLSHRPPYPPNKGDKIRAHHIFLHLAKRHDVWLGALADDAGDLAHARWFDDRCAGVCLKVRRPLETARRIAGAGLSGSAMSVAAFANAELNQWCGSILNAVQPDLVYVFSSAMAQYVVDRLPKHAALITDFVDVDSEKFRQYAAQRGGARGFVYSVEAARLGKFDCRVARASGACLFVSRTEHDLFSALCPAAVERLRIVPNGVDSAYFDPALNPSAGSPAEPILAFMGTMDYFPNIDAVRWFAASILPRVQSEVPNVRMCIVGARPTQEVKALALDPAIVVTGAVSDIRPYYAQAAVVIAPLRIARGIQNKVLEAMAMARPMVTTSAALDGIAAENGKHLLVGETEAEFARAVIQVLQGRSPTDMGRDARKCVLANHEWSAHMKQLDAVIGGLIG